MIDFAGERPCPKSVDGRHDYPERFTRHTWDGNCRRCGMPLVRFPTLYTRTGTMVGLPMSPTPICFAPEVTAVVHITSWVPLRVSRLRWGPHPGLHLLNLRVGTLNITAGPELQLSLAEAGMWRFPAQRVYPSVPVQVLIHNASAAPVTLRDMTVWGIEPEPAIVGRYNVKA